MHKNIQIRLAKFLMVSLCIIIGVTIILSSLKENIIFFYTPTDLMSKNTQAIVRMGGIVKPNSIKVEQDENIFVLTDGTTEITVHYKGSLPMLFREEQGIVAEGSLKGDGTFQAKRILAKHDENYIPKELANELKNKGYWKGETVAKP